MDQHTLIQLLISKEKEWKK